MLVAAIVFVATLSWIFWVAAVGTTVRALEPRRCKDGPTPPVSILKPVRGLDFEAWENFVSHCEQRYPTFEIVFGVAEMQDPAVRIIEQLRARYGTDRVRLVVAKDDAPNPKAGLLDQLARSARYDILVATDSDVRVRDDFLASVVPRLADEAVGLVTLPYRGDRIFGLVAAFEALGMETALLPSAVIGKQLLRRHFALVAANALRRDTLERIGGFRAVSTYLADDYQLGLRVGEAGLRVEISEQIVASVLGKISFRDWWRREVRWTRAIRASRRAHYPGLILTFSTPLGLIAAMAGAGWLPLIASLLVRWNVGWEMTRCTGHRELRKWLWLLPLRDLLSAAIWLAGIVGRRVHWRGRTFLVASDGQLLPDELLELHLGTHHDGSKA